ncbi:MAG: hypothetical protein ACRDD2_02635 [Sarcina sp.]
MIKNELKKSINIYLILALVIIGFLVNFFAMYDDISPSINILTGADVASLSQGDIDYLNTMSKQYQNTFMAWRFGIMGYEIVCIILTTLAYSITYIIDKKSGFLKNILLKVKKKKYFFVKSLVNFSIGGLIVIIPTLLSLLLYFIWFDSSTLPASDLKAFFPFGFMSNYFESNPLIYILFFTIILFFIGGVYSTFSLAISCLTNNIISTILIPILFWFLGSILLNSLGLSQFAPWNIYYFTVNSNISFFFSFILTFLLFIGSLLIIYRESKLEQL